MTEKELLERISKTTIRSLISTSDPERESIVDESREQSELLSKLTAFLLAQDNVTTLLDTFLSIPTDMKVPVQLNIKQLFACYDSRLPKSRQGRKRTRHQTTTRTTFGPSQRQPICHERRTI